MDKKNIETIFPLTEMQSALLFHHLQTNQKDLGFLQLQVTFQGELDRDIFQSTWQSLSKSLPSLRTTVHWEKIKRPVQAVHNSVEIKVDFKDWRERSKNDLGTNLQSFLHEERIQGLDLTESPPMRLTLIQTSKRKHYFIWSCHHILLDGWSGLLVLQRMMDVYGSIYRKENPVEIKTTPFKQYVKWLESQSQVDSKNYWKSQFEEMQKPILLGSRGVNANPDILNERTKTIYSDSLSDSILKKAAQNYGVTPGVLILGTWAILFSELVNSLRIAIGITFSGRTAPVDGIESMVGMFSNSLPLCLNVDPELSLGEWFKHVILRQKELQRFEFSSPRQVYEWSGISANSLIFNTLLVFANQPWKESLKSEGLLLEDLKGDFTSNHKWTLVVRPGKKGSLQILYNGDENEARLADYIGQRFDEVLSKVVSSKSLEVADVMREHNLLAGDKEAPNSPNQLNRGNPTQARDLLDAEIQKVWENVFGIGRIGIDEDFFELGGNSLIATILIGQLQKCLVQNIFVDSLFNAPTIRQLSDLLNDVDRSDKNSILVPIQSAGNGTPVIFIHEMGGNVYPYLLLGKYLQSDHPVFAIRAPEIAIESIEEMSKSYIEEIEKAFGNAPVILAGYCFGGAVAYDMARRISKKGKGPPLTIIIDFMYLNLIRYRPRYLFNLLKAETPHKFYIRIKDKLKKVYGKVVRALTNSDKGLRDEVEDYFELPAAPEAVQKKIETHFRAMRDYKPGQFEGDICLILSESTYSKFDQCAGWDRLVSGKIDVSIIEADHVSLMEEPQISLVAKKVEKILGRLNSRLQKDVETKLANLS